MTYLGMKAVLLMKSPTQSLNYLNSDQLLFQTYQHSSSLSHVPTYSECA